MTTFKQIKAEIERRITDNTFGAKLELIDILAWLDTLESEKPMQEDLEKELDKWRHEHFHGKRDNHFSGEYLERTSQLDLARHFAKWQKEQDDKEAVEGTVTCQNLNRYILVSGLDESLTYGDKVRIIICKKED